MTVPVKFLAEKAATVLAARAESPKTNSTIPKPVRILFTEDSLSATIDIMH